MMGPVIRTVSGVLFTVSLCTLSAGCAANGTDPPQADTFTVDPPGTTPAVLAPGHISTPGQVEMGCTFSVDLSEFWFGRSTGSEDFPAYVLMVSYIDGDQWSEPVVASFDPECLEVAPHMAPDGERFLFYRQKPDDPSFQEGTWVAEKTDDGWGEPVFFHTGYCITSALDGWYYFCTDHQEATSRDLARFRIEAGEPSAAEDLPGTVNTVNFEAHPWVSADGDLILFDYAVLGVPFSGKIYVTFRNPDGSWGTPIDLGPEINDGHTMISSLSPDGEYLLYSQGGDLMWVDAEVVYALRPGG